jgi:hypothetical protein
MCRRTPPPPVSLPSERDFEVATDFHTADQQGGPSIRQSALWYAGERKHEALRVNVLNFSSFDMEMVKPRSVGAEKQSARAH